MFPTSIRSTSLGLCSLLSRVGGILAPLITNLQNSTTFGKNLPLILFGLFGLFSAFSAFFLPETAGKKLPETIEEAEKSDDSYKVGDFFKYCSSRVR